MDIPEFAFNPFDSSVARDPYPMYAQMREAGRVLKSPMGFLIAHRYEDVRRAHGDHESLSMGAMGAMGAMAMAGGGGGMQGGDFMMASTMLTADPPDHERLRGVVYKAFTPRSIAAVEPRVREISEELLAPLAKGEPFDIVADFAAPLPTTVISELMGIPAEDGQKFRMWTEVVTGTDVRNRWRERGGSRNYGQELREYFREQIERKRDEPADDLIGRMVAANNDEVMSDEEIVASCILLLIAGNETTMRLVSNMTVALGRFPEQRDRLVAEPGLIANAVEETLRYDSPVQMLFRGVKEETTLGDAVLKPGQAVLTMLAAANRDPEQFEDPDRYDVGREDIAHAAFGHGIHYCLGAPLARRETRIAFEALLDVAPQFEVLTADDDLEYSPGILRSPRSVMVKL